MRILVRIEGDDDSALVIEKTYSDADSTMEDPKRSAISIFAGDKLHKIASQVQLMSYE